MLRVATQVGEPDEPRTNIAQGGQQLCGKWMPRKKATEDSFAQLLVAQDYACGMCREPFKEGQRIHVNHDHACCKDKCRSCGKCVRGLLCHVCNIALGHIERRYALSRLYLDNLPAQLVARAGRAA